MNQNQSFQISENVYLRRISNSSKYHYYFVYNDKQYRASTKTSDYKKACSIALKAFKNAQNQCNSCSIISFKKCTERYVESIKFLKKERFHRETIQRHFAEYFNDFKNINDISLLHLNQYLDNRRKKSEYRILNQSINKESAVFNQMMRYAFENEWISKEIRFKNQSERNSYNRRQHFSIKEYKNLIKTSRNRRDQFWLYKTKKEQSLHIVRYWQRSLLHDIIILLANSGLRVDEVKTIKWKDIDWNNSIVKLTNAGKTNSSRVVLVRTMGMTALKRLEDRRKKYLLEKKGNLSINELIHSLADGTYVHSQRKGFNELLNACGFKYASKHEKHSLTSLRHTYATFRLTTKKEKRASIRALSKQMGTSQNMIEKHYGHDVVEDYRHELLN